MELCHEVGRLARGRPGERGRSSQSPRPRRPGANPTGRTRKAGRSRLRTVFELEARALSGAVAQRALDVAPRLPLGFGGSLVVELLAADDADVDLGTAALEGEAKGDEGHPLLLDR